MLPKNVSGKAHKGKSVTFCVAFILREKILFEDTGAQRVKVDNWSKLRRDENWANCAKRVLGKSHIHPSNLVSTEPITENENHERLSRKDQIAENLKKKRKVVFNFLNDLCGYVTIEEKANIFDFWNAGKI